MSECDIVQRNKPQSNAQATHTDRCAACRNRNRRWSAARLLGHMNDHVEDRARYVRGEGKKEM